MKAACGAAALLVVATSAQATEPDYTNFNGLYAGIQGGYSSGHIELFDRRIGGMDVGISGFLRHPCGSIAHLLFLERPLLISDTCRRDCARSEENYQACPECSSSW